MLTPITTTAEESGTQACWTHTVGSRQPLLPKHLRSVNQFLENHLHESLSADDLAHVAGTSVRSLYSHFRDFIGMTPMEYVKVKRLELARKVLLQGTAPSVSAVAIQTGFNHLGRFSGEYKKRFGESPKHTLKFAPRSSEP